MKLRAGKGYIPDVRDPRCKEICLNFRAKQSWGMSRYADGQSFCPICHVFMKVSGKTCPCCKGQLRFKPIENKN